MSWLLLLSGLIHGLGLLLLPLWGRGSRLGERSSDAAIDLVIPARNEASNIAAAVRAAQGAGVRSVTVVDDGSNDDTAAIAQAVASELTHVMSGVPPEPGWAGKPWACQQGGARGDAEWVLFLDADVRIEAHVPTRLVAFAQSRGLDLVSAYGTWELGSYWERAAIVPIGWSIRAWADPARVNAGRLAFANGQCLLVRRATWQAMGGHAVVQGAVLDDVLLAEAVATRGGRVGLTWGPDLFTVRLYRDLRQILDGYGKNLLVGLGGRRWLAGVAAVAVALFALVPWVVLLGRVVTGRSVLLPATVCALMCAHRAALDVRSGGRWLGPDKQPLGTLVLVLVLVRAGLQTRARWKGRVFEAGQASSRPQE